MACQRIKLLRSAPVLALFLLLSACAEFGWNPLDPKNFKDPPPQLPPATTLGLEVETLEKGSSLFQERLHEEENVLERRRSWRGNPASDASASLVLMQGMHGQTLSPPGDPQHAVKLWEPLSWRTLTFQDLYKSRNAIGDVHWRRFIMGGAPCVIFQQGWGGEGAERPGRILSGYYCAPVGGELSEGQAETVVRSVRIWDQD